MCRMSHPGTRHRRTLHNPSGSLGFRSSARQWYHTNRAGYSTGQQGTAPTAFARRTGSRRLAWRIRRGVGRRRSTRQAFARGPLVKREDSWRRAWTLSPPVVRTTGCCRRPAPQTQPATTICHHAQVRQAKPHWLPGSSCTSHQRQAKHNHAPPHTNERAQLQRNVPLAT